MSVEVGSTSSRLLLLTTMSIELSLPKRILSVISNVKAVAPPRCVPT